MHNFIKEKNGPKILQFGRLIPTTKTKIPI